MIDDDDCRLLSSVRQQCQFSGLRRVNSDLLDYIFIPTISQTTDNKPIENHCLLCFQNSLFLDNHLHSILQLEGFLHNQSCIPPTRSSGVIDWTLLTSIWTEINAHFACIQQRCRTSRIFTMNFEPDFHSTRNNNATEMSRKQHRLIRKLKRELNVVYRQLLHM